MKLSWRISLLILVIILFSTLTNFLLAQYQLQTLYRDSEKILAHTIVQSLRDVLVQDVIDGNKLRVTNLLRSLKGHDNPIEFLYVTDGGHSLFAHSFDQGFPRYLTVKNEPHLDRIGTHLVHKYQTESDLIYEYSEALIPGLETILHIGINQSDFSEKLISNQQSILLSSIAIALLAFLIAYFWSRQITRPLTEFAEQIQRFGSGESVDFTNFVKSSPEIHHLSSAFQSAMSERIKAVVALQESEEQVHLLLDSTAEAIYGINTDGSCTFVNQACLNMLGYKNTTELLGKNMHDIIHHSFPDGSDYPKEQCRIYQAFRSGHKVHADDEVLWRQDGSHFAVEYWSHPIFKDNECIGAVVTFLDITNRIETMRALQDREENLAITLNSIGDAVITTDANGIVTHLNPVAEQLTGWSNEVALGQSVKTVFPIIDATTRKPIENPIEKVLASGEIVYLSNHTTLIAKDGTEYQIADSAAPIRNDDGQIAGMVLVCNDVTEKYLLRQAINKQLERFKELSNLALTLTGEPQEVFNNITALLGKLLKVKVVCLSEVRGDELYFLSVNIDGKSYTNAGKCDLSITPCATVEADKDIRVYHQVTELFPEASFLKDHEAFSYCGFPALDSKGNVLAVTCLLDDKPHEFTEDDQDLLRIFGQRIGLELERVENQKKLQDQEQQLRQSQKMEALGKLTGGIAHDHNNMLGVILGYVHLLKDKLNEQPELARYAEQIQHAGERGAMLTKKLLAFSQQKPSDAESLDLNELLQNEQHMLEKTLTPRIKLVLDLAEELWSIWVDSGDMEDAILNMSINAMHAIEAQGQLTIQTYNQQISELDAQLFNLKAGDYVAVSLSDTGCGMDKETKEKIFEPFYSTKGEKGTGLGLSQVYGFAERSGGAIYVYSEPGHGTRFILYFPRHHKSNGDDHPDMHGSAIDLSGNETILVVEDELALLDLTAEILGQQGYNVICAENGKQALAVLEHDPIDLLLSDVIMPSMDGYQLAAIVQEKYPDVKIQLVSGFTDEVHKDMVDDTLRQNLLYKPFHPQRLLVKMRELLEM